MTAEQLLEDVARRIESATYAYLCAQAGTIPYSQEVFVARAALDVAIEAAEKVVKEEIEKQKNIAAASNASERFHSGGVTACRNVEAALIALKPKD